MRSSLLQTVGIYSSPGGAQAADYSIPHAQKIRKQIYSSLGGAEQPTEYNMHKKSENSASSGDTQCPTGRFFQYRVGYWTKYRVAGRVQVG